MQFERAENTDTKEQQNTMSTADLVGAKFMEDIRGLQDSSKSTTANNLPDLKLYDLSSAGGRDADVGKSNNIADRPRVIECPGVKGGQERSQEALDAKPSDPVNKVNTDKYSGIHESGSRDKTGQNSVDVDKYSGIHNDGGRSKQPVNDMQQQIEHPPIGWPGGRPKHERSQDALRK